MIITPLPLGFGIYETQAITSTETQGIQLMRPSSPIVAEESDRTLQTVRYEEEIFQSLLHDLRMAVLPHAPILSPPSPRPNSLMSDINVSDTSNMAVLMSDNNASDTPAMADGDPQPTLSHTQAALYIGLGGRRSYLEFISLKMPESVPAADLLNYILKPTDESPLTLTGRVLGKLGTDGLYVGKSMHIFDITKAGWSSPSLGFLELGLLNDVLEGNTAQLPYHYVRPSLASEERGRVLESYALSEDARIYSVYLYREVRVTIWPDWIR